MVPSLRMRHPYLHLITFVEETNLHQVCLSAKQGSLSIDDIQTPLNYINNQESAELHPLAQQEE